jgi:hypothetical protein
MQHDDLPRQAPKIATKIGPRRTNVEAVLSLTHDWHGETFNHNDNEDRPNIKKRQPICSPRPDIRAVASRGGPEIDPHAAETAAAAAAQATPAAARLRDDDRALLQALTVPRKHLRHRHVLLLQLRAATAAFPLRGRRRLLGVDLCAKRRCLNQFSLRLPRACLDKS